MKKPLISGKILLVIKRNYLSERKLYESLRFFVGGVAGFSLFWITSHQNSPVKKRLPTKKVKRVHVFPNIRVEFSKDRHAHLHHWVIFSASYVLLRKRVRKSSTLHGFLIGSILQGLTYKDRFKFVKQPSLDA